MFKSLIWLLNIKKYKHVMQYVCLHENVNDKFEFGREFLQI
jgi:hypothetical protein